MNVRTILTRTTAATAFAASLIFASACAHNSAADNADYGQVAQNEPATSATMNSTTPIPGPAKMDNSGNVYTSSAAPATGNSSGTGTNTNVNIIPGKNTGSTTVAYNDQAPVTTTVETPTSVTTVETTPVATTETTQTTTETTTTPMTSSSTEKTTMHHHRRMRKD